MRLEARAYTTKGTEENIARFFKNHIVNDYLRKLDLGAKTPESDADWDWVVDTAPPEMDEYISWRWTTQSEGDGAHGFLVITSPVILSKDKLGKAFTIFENDGVNLHLEAVATN